MSNNFPYHLLTGHRVYWCDTEQIESVTVDGGDRRLHVKIDEYSPWRLALHGTNDDILFTEAGDNAIIGANRSGGDSYVIRRTSLPNPRGIFATRMLFN